METSLKKISPPITKKTIFLILLGVTPFLLLSAYFVYMVWEAQKIGAFCKAVRPGEAASSISEIADSYGINPRSMWETKNGDLWHISVPVTAAMGEFKCKITHDGTKIISVGDRK